jgi:hypothetical protein
MSIEGLNAARKPYRRILLTKSFMSPGALLRAVRSVPVNIIIWSFPLVFLVHDIEEILTIERYASGAFSMFPAPGLSLSAIEFSVSVALIFTGCVAISYFASREPRHASGAMLFALGVSGLFVNVLTHAGLSLLTIGYSPGVITAVLLVLPYCVLAIYRVMADGLVTRAGIIRSAAAAAILILPAIILALTAGKLVGLVLFNF